MKILVADDDRDQLAVREMLLLQCGFEPILANDAESALLAAKAERPACAIVDLRLPSEKSGLSLIRDLKIFDQNLRIFVLTGANRARLEGLPEGRLVDAVLEKGSASVQLIKRLRKLQAAQDIRTHPGSAAVSGRRG